MSSPEFYNPSLDGGAEDPPQMPIDEDGYRDPTFSEPAYCFTQGQFITLVIIGAGLMGFSASMSNPDGGNTVSDSRNRPAQPAAFYDQCDMKVVQNARITVSHENGAPIAPYNFSGAVCGCDGNNPMYFPEGSDEATNLCHGDPGWNAYLDFKETERLKRESNSVREQAPTQNKSNQVTSPNGGYPRVINGKLYLVPPSGTNPINPTMETNNSTEVFPTVVTESDTISPYRENNCRRAIGVAKEGGINRLRGGGTQTCQVDPATGNLVWR